MGSRDSWRRWRPLHTRSCSFSTTCTSSGRARASRSSPHSPSTSSTSRPSSSPAEPSRASRSAACGWPGALRDRSAKSSRWITAKSVSSPAASAWHSSTPTSCELAVRTEGWAAGTYLAALTLKDLRAGAERPTGGGGDRFHVDYFDYEHLSRLDPSEVQFLTRTAVLDRMCGPLCDAMLESTGSAARLESLARSNLFVVRLDTRRSWYRYHRGFRDFLRAELGSGSPRSSRSSTAARPPGANRTTSPRPASPMPARPETGTPRALGHAARAPVVLGGSARHGRELARLVRRGASSRAAPDGRCARRVGALTERQTGGCEAMARRSRPRHRRTGSCPTAAARSSRGSPSFVQQCAATVPSGCGATPRRRCAISEHRAPCVRWLS